MNDSQKHSPIQTDYATIDGIANALRLSAYTLKGKLVMAKKMGVPLPERRRVAKKYFYKITDFVNWLWENGERLKQPTHFNQSKAE